VINFTKIRPAIVELLHAQRRTDGRTVHRLGAVSQWWACGRGEGNEASGSFLISRQLPAS